jgi:uncharacterized DUF497 family protein
MNCSTIHFSGHATVQMFKRNISVDDIEFVINEGIIIKNYPDDKPFPSYLILGKVNNRKIHVVMSRDNIGNCYIITAYQPDADLWIDDFTSKK